MIRKGWSYKEDRRLLKLAGSGKTLEQIAKAMDRTPDSIRNRSIRLGVSIRSKAVAVWVYVNTSKQVDDPEHLKVFANQDAAETWFAENDPEGVAFEYEVLA